MDLNYEIGKILLKQGNKKVKNESLSEFLASFTKDELLYMIKFYLTRNMDNKNIVELFLINSKTKKEIIEYIKKNFEKMILEFLKILDDEERKDLKYISGKVNKDDYLIDYDFKLRTIQKLKEYSLAKIEYNEKKDSIKIFIPKEFNEAISKHVNEEKIILEAKKYNELSEYLELILNTYGIITFNELNKLYGRDFHENKKLFSEILKISFDNESVNIAKTDDEYLIYGVGYDEDDVYYFYEMQNMDYKEYSKEEMQEIYDYIFLKRLIPYKRVKIFLEENFCVNESDMDDFIMNIIGDYIYMAQIDEEKAISNYRNNIDKICELNEEEINYIEHLLNKIFEKYPKWQKRGNI